MATIVTGTGDFEYLFIDPVYNIEILIKAASYADAMAIQTVIEAALLADSEA